MKPANPSNNRLFTPQSYESRLAAQSRPRSKSELAFLRFALPLLPRVQCPGAAVVYLWDGGTPTVTVEKVPPLVREARPLGRTSGYW